MQSSSVIDLVKGVFMNPDNVSRAQNEVVLSELILQRPDHFAEQSCAEFQRDTNVAAIRVLVATALKMTIQLKDGQRSSPFWTKLASETKEKIKTTALTTLIDSNAQVRSAAASLYALVFVVDFLSGRQLPDLLSPITGNISHVEPKIRQASVQTLGSICELLAQHKVTNFDENSFNQLVTGICLGLKNTDETTPTAVKALSDAVVFISSKFESQEFTSFIFERLLTILGGAFGSQTWDLFETVLLSLGKVVKLVYPRMDAYAPHFVDALVTCLTAPSDKALLNLTELFISTLRLEKRHQKGFFSSSWQTILEGTMGLLFTRLGKSGEAEDELVDNFVEIIRSLNRVFVTQSYPVLMKFVQDNWEAPNEVQRLSAICALDSLVESAGPEILEPLNQSFVWILNCVKNGQSLRVALRALELLSQITAFKPDVVFTDINFQRLTDDFLIILNTSAPNDQALKLKTVVAKTLVGIIDRAEHTPRYVTTIRCFSSQLQQSIFQAIESESSALFIEWLFSILFSLARLVLPLDQLSDYFLKLLALHEKILNSFHGDNKTNIFETSLINLWLVLRQLRKGHRMLQFRDRDAQKDLQLLLNNLNTLFLNGNQVLPDGITLMTEILLQFPEHFQPFVRTFYEHYLSKGLTDLTMPKLMEACIRSFSEIFKAFPLVFNDIINSFIEYAIHTLRNPDLPHDLRIHLFAFMVDVTLFKPEAVLPTLNSWLELSVLGLEAIAYYQTTDKENTALFEEFRYIIIEFVDTLIIQLYQLNSQCEAPIEAAFSNIQAALKKVLESSPSNFEKDAASCLYLICDFYVKKRLDHVIDRALVSQLWAVAGTVPSSATSELRVYLSQVGLIQ
jgi:hypothetical protein